jgi:hypothetical protein
MVRQLPLAFLFIQIPTRHNLTIILASYGGVLDV